MLGKIKGEYFIRTVGSLVGEIGIELECSRSANVVSMDYTILSRVSAANYKICCKNDVKLRRSVRKHISCYDDNRSTMLKEIIRDTFF